MHVALLNGGTGLYEHDSVIASPLAPSPSFGLQVELVGLSVVGGTPGPGVTPCSAEVYIGAPAEAGVGRIYQASGGPGCGWVLDPKSMLDVDTPSDPASGAAEGGAALDVHDGRVIVGAPGNASGRGSAYLLEDWSSPSESCLDLYLFSGGPVVWSATQRIGASVAVSSQWALVGAPGAPGVEAGFVWVFENLGGGWSYHSTLPASGSTRASASCWRTTPRWCPTGTAPATRPCSTATWAACGAWTRPSRRSAAWRRSSRPSAR